MAKSTENVNIGVYINGSAAEGSLKALGGEVRKLKNELALLAPGTAEFNKKLDELKGKDAAFQKVRQEVGQTKTSLDSMKDSWMKMIGVYTAVIAAGAGVISFFKNSIQGAIDDEKAERQLFLALNQNSEKLKEYLSLKERFMKTTLFQEDEIYNALNLAAAMGRTAEQAEKMLKAAGGLATVTGTDLNTAMLQLNGTLEGTLGRLAKYDKSLSDLTKEQLANGEAIDILSNKLGKFATSGMDSTAGAIDRYQKAMERFRDTIGNTLLKWLGFQQAVEGNASTKKEKQELTDIAKFTAMGKDERAAYIKGWQAEQDRYFQLWQQAKTEENEKNRAFYSIQFADTKNFVDKLKELQSFDANEKKSTEGKVKLNEKTKDVITSYQLLNDEITEYIALLKESVINGDDRVTQIYIEKIKRLETEKKKIDDLVKSYTELSKQTPFKTTSGGMQAPGDTMSPVGNAPFEDISSIDQDTKQDQLTWEEMSWDQRGNYVLNYAQTAINALSSVDQVMSQMENSQLARDTQLNDQKKTNLKRQLDAKVITQKQYDSQILKLDSELAKEQRKIQHEQAVRNKEIQLVNAIIGAAQMAISGYMTTPFMPLGLIMGTLAVILGAIQVAAIAKAPVPAAAKGRYNVIGQGDGKAYNDVPYSESFTGIPGRPMLVNETGNEIVIDPATTKNLLVNYPDVIRAINFARVPQMASGAYGAISGSSSSGQVVVMMDPKYLAGLDKFNDTMEKINKEGLQARISYDEFYNIDDKVNRIKSDASRV